MNYSTIQKILYTQIQLNKLFKIHKDDILESMERVDFIEQNEFHVKSRRLLGEPTTPTMIRILLRTGLAQNEKQALLMLIGFMLAILTITTVLINARINPPTSNLVVDAQGNSYTFEQYIDLVRQGKDPLLPQ